MIIKNRQQLADKAVQLYESGLIIREVAAELGISKSTAYRMLKERGVAFRPDPHYYRNQWKARQAAARINPERARQAGLAYVDPVAELFSELGLD